VEVKHQVIILLVVITQEVELQLQDQDLEQAMWILQEKDQLGLLQVKEMDLEMFQEMMYLLEELAVEIVRLDLVKEEAHKEQVKVKEKDKPLMAMVHQLQELEMVQDKHKLMVMQLVQLKAQVKEVAK